MINEDYSEELLSTAKTSRSRSTNFTTPSFSDQLVKSIKSCTSIHIGVNAISWCYFDISHEDNKLRLLDWNYYELEEKKYHLSELLNIVLSICEKMPDADTYVIENPQTPQQSTVPGSVLQMNVNLQQSQLISMIAALLGYRKYDVKLNTNTCVYFLRRFLAARFFNIFVGNEKLSTSQVVANLFDSNEQTTPNKIDLAASSTLVNNYYSLNKINQEVLGQSLILGASFIKLCVLQCNDSINKITTRS